MSDGDSIVGEGFHLIATSQTNCIDVSITRRLVLMEPVHCTVVQGSVSVLPMDALLSTHYLPSVAAQLNASCSAPISLIPDSVGANLVDLKDKFCEIYNRQYERMKRHVYTSSDAYDALQSIVKWNGGTSKERISTTPRDLKFDDPYEGDIASMKDKLVVRLRPTDQAGQIILHRSGPIAFLEYVSSKDKSILPDGYDVFYHITSPPSHRNTLVSFLSPQPESPRILVSGMSHYNTNTITQQVVNLTLRHYPVVAVISLHAESPSFGTPGTLTLTLVTRQWTGNRIASVGGLGGENNSISAEAKAFSSSSYTSFVDEVMTNGVGAVSLGRVFAGTSLLVHKSPGMVLTATAVFLERWRLLIKCIPKLVDGYRSRALAEGSQKAVQEWKSALKELAGCLDSQTDGDGVPLPTLPPDHVLQDELDVLIRRAGNPNEPNVMENLSTYDSKMLQIDELRRVGIPLLVFSPSSSNEDGPISWQMTESLIGLVEPHLRVRYEDPELTVHSSCFGKDGSCTEGDLGSKVKILDIPNPILKSVSRLGGSFVNPMFNQSVTQSKIVDQLHLPQNDAKLMFASKYIRATIQWQSFLLQWRPYTLGLTYERVLHFGINWDLLLSNDLSKVFHHDIIDTSSYTTAVDDEVCDGERPSIGKPIREIKADEEVIILDINITSFKLHLTTSCAPETLGTSRDGAVRSIKRILGGRMVAFCRKLSPRVVDPFVVYRRSSKNTRLLDPVLPEALFEFMYSAFVYDIRYVSSRNSDHRRSGIFATLAVPVMDIPVDIREAIRSYLQDVDTMIPYLQDLAWDPAYPAMCDLKCHPPPPLVKPNDNIIDMKHLNGLDRGLKIYQQAPSILWTTQKSCGSKVSSKRTHQFGWGQQGGQQGI
eukprot:GHVH01004152.1.p1 GENE.GHVH01004152.1~~GHVH01004152.1.p1  ORF type:complete len:880 (-),score=91.40 GHVH01004152.1:31-2670(-)